MIAWIPISLDNNGMFQERRKVSKYCYKWPLIDLKLHLITVVSIWNTAAPSNVSVEMKGRCSTLGLINNIRDRERGNKNLNQKRILQKSLPLFSLGLENDLWLLCTRPGKHLLLMLLLLMMLRCNAARCGTGFSRLLLIALSYPGCGGVGAANCRENVCSMHVALAHHHLAYGSPSGNNLCTVMQQS